MLSTMCIYCKGRCHNIVIKRSTTEMLYSRNLYKAPGCLLKTHLFKDFINDTELQQLGIPSPGRSYESLEYILKNIFLVLYSSDDKTKPIILVSKLIF